MMITRGDTALRFDAIGTTWQIDTPRPIGARVTASIADTIENFDRTWSRFRDDSLVQAIATKPGRYAFGPEAPALFEVYRELYACTDGRVSPLVGRALEQSGYNREYSLLPTTVSAIPRWADALAWDGTHLSTVSPVVLDVGAAGKGYLVDLVARELQSSGVDQFTIDASGDIVHQGPTPLRVALEHPRDATLAIGIANVDRALCASSSNRRAWADTHHIIDGLTGLPTRDVIATWVIADTGLIADGVATALFFVDAERLEKSFAFEFVRMFASGRVQSSAHFDGELFA